MRGSCRHELAAARRGMARDLGESLGCGAHLRGLRRTKSGRFTVDGALTVAQLKDLASRFDMSESTVIMLAIDRLARDTQQGKDLLPEGDADKEGVRAQKKGGQDDGNGKTARTRRRIDLAAQRRKVGGQD